MNFEEIFERIKKETSIKSISELATFLGTTQPYVSRKKSENNFSVKWAYQIAITYDLSTDWIMTGKGPKKLMHSSNQYAMLIGEWVDEMAITDPGRQEWFRCSFEDAFPAFKIWQQERERIKALEPLSVSLRRKFDEAVS